jgi:hypothetical protein
MFRMAFVWQDHITHAAVHEQVLYDDVIAICTLLKSCGNATWRDLKSLRSDKSSSSVRKDDKARKSYEKWNRWYSKRFPYVDGQIKLAQKGKKRKKIRVIIRTTDGHAINEYVNENNNSIRIHNRQLILTYLLTYSMKRSPSWEAKRFSASQEIPLFLWNPKVHYRIHKCPPPVHINHQLIRKEINVRKFK